MSKKARLSIIAAVSLNGVIGRKNSLPWSLPADLKRFKEITYGAPIIMGRKTYESIGRLLPGRKNIIITRDPSRMIPGATLARSLDEAIEVARLENSDEIYVIGGGEIYRQALSMVDRLYITEVDVRIDDGDAFFPEWPVIKSESVMSGGRFIQFTETKREEMNSDRPSFRFLIFDRTPSEVRTPN